MKKILLLAAAVLVLSGCSGKETTLENTVPSAATETDLSADTEENVNSDQGKDDELEVSDNQDQNAEQSSNSEKPLIGGFIMDSGEEIETPENATDLIITEEANVEFLFTTDKTLYHLEFVSISYDGVNCEEKEVLYSEDEFLGGDLVKVSTYLPDTFSNLLIRYEDENGTKSEFLVNYNMTGEGDLVVLQSK